MNNLTTREKAMAFGILLILIIFHMDGRFRDLGDDRRPERRLG